MKKVMLLVLLMVLAVACSQTKVVSISDDGSNSDNSDSSTNNEATPNEDSTSQEQSNPTSGAAVATGGKTAVSCDDLDSGDYPEEMSKVEVKYDDGTSSVYYDQCVSFGTTSSNMLVEYYCVGNEAKSKNHQCDDTCISLIVKADPTNKVGYCS